MTSNLSNARVLVLGATGNVGHGVATAMLEAGATVLAPTRSESGKRELEASFAGTRLEALVGDISDPRGAEQLADAIAARGALDHVVASLGPWWQGGAIADQDPAEWAKVRAMLLDGHVHAAELFLPLLAARAAASYTIITGMGAHHLIPGAGLLFVATGGVLSLSKVLRAEHAKGPVRVNELLIHARIEKEARPGVTPSAEFGRSVVALVAGDRRSEVVHFPASAGL